MVEAPYLGFGVEAWAPKSRVRVEVNVKSVGFDGEGVPTGSEGEAGAEGVPCEGVSRDLVGRCVMLGELTREGYVTESEGVVICVT